MSQARTGSHAHASVECGSGYCKLQIMCIPTEIAAQFSCETYTMGERQLLTMMIEGRTIRAALVDGDLWFSQASLAKVLETTSQNVTIHISKLARYMDVGKMTRYLAIDQTEGRRRVRRKVKVYNLEIAHAIALPNDSAN